MKPQTGLQPPHGCPAHHTQSLPIQLYGQEFAAAPEIFYQEMRRHGAATLVEMAPGVEATLVTDYATALHVLQTPDLFSKDARRWRALNEGRVPADSPALAMMAYRPNCMFTDGADHARLRRAVTNSFAEVDPHQLSRQVGWAADFLIDQFVDRGEVDLLDDYAKALPLLVFTQLFDCPAEIGDRVVHNLSALFDGVDTETADAELVKALVTHVTSKRSRLGKDLTSRLIAHPARLNDEEMVHQLVLLMGAGTEPLRNLIGNSLCLLLSDERFTGSSFRGGLLVDDAIDHVLWNQPPLANYGIHYPVEDTDLGGVTVKAGDPVVISFAAANTDPAMDSSDQMLSKRAHLAWSAGPHSCPGKDRARLITLTAIEKLLNRIPDVELTVSAEALTWRPGAFHRALESLPARFTPTRRKSPPVATDHSRRQAAEQGRAPRKGRWSSFLAWLTG
ncbi:MAG: cytochrome P450 [Thermocrispum sp.]